MDKILTPVDYEKHLVAIMYEDDVTLSEALYIDFWANEVNMHSVYDLVDYLERRLEDLDKVKYYMEVWNGDVPDVGLKKL